MPETAMIELAGVIVLGIGAQWIAWRIGLPSILLLLLFGVLAGPLLGWLHPDQLFGDLLAPFVSLSVALILYEGGLTLRMRELQKVGGVVRNLVTVGALVTLVLGALAARFILNVPWQIAALLGAVVIVTGPTVIQPLLRHIRPAGPVGPVLKWEGIVIDPIGALVAVLLYEAILIGEASQAGAHMAGAVFKTIAFGGGIGFAAALVLTVLISRYLIADHLQNAVSLMLVILSFVAANHYQEESGLLAVTVMGFVLANQKRADIEHIVEFKENLRVLLISNLFILLSARLDFAALGAVLWRGLIFCAALIVIVRPASVFVSSWRSKLTIRERAFLSWMAPRGIVAAAVASVFALKLEDAGITGGETLAPVVFLVIIVTVALYGLSAPLVGRLLKVAEAQPQGILFIGAGQWARATAELLHREKFRVVLIDSNWDNAHTARMAGLKAHCGNILAEHTLDELDLGGIGRVLAVTPNDLVNVMAIRRLQTIFGSANCFKAAPRQAVSKKEKDTPKQRGRVLFREGATLAELNRMMAEGYTVKATKLSEEFTMKDFRARYGESALPMFLINAKKRLSVIESASTQNTQAVSVISLVQDKE